MTERTSEACLWLARDKSGFLFGFEHKPIRKRHGRKLSDNYLPSDNSRYWELPEWMFPDITLQNSPQKMSLVVKGRIVKETEEERLEAISRMF